MSEKIDEVGHEHKHEHNHNHAGHSHLHDMSEIKGRNLIAVILLNFIITAAEIIGGVIAGSLSLISDALHNFSDGVSVIISYFAFLITKKKNDNKKTFGYKRAEILAAIINSSVLIIISIYLFREAYLKLINPEAVNGLYVIAVAVVALIANTFSVFLLEKGSQGDMNIKSTYLHLLSDALSSLAVIIGGAAIYFFKAYWIDPVLTILIGLYVLKESYEILKKAINILMQGVPEGFNIEKIVKDLKKIDLIEDIHHVHLWSLTEKDVHFEAHANIKDIKISETKPIMEKIEHILDEHYGINHATIQFEYKCCGGTEIINNESRGC